MPVVTQDSDCPESKRSAYIGTDNVEAGRRAGEELVRLLPDGGQVALFVGKLDVANARERKQGIEQVIEGHPIEIVEVFTDEVQRSVAQSNVRNALDKYPELAAMVGLWSYNTPAIVKVVQERGLEGRITIVGFDEEGATLDAVADGTVASTVVQQPFEFGYRSIRALALLARGENAGLPADGLEYVPVRVIDREQVEPFRRDLLRQLDEGRAEG
jgi:ribose transport system substrate-binding protein